MERSSAPRLAAHAFPYRASRACTNRKKEKAEEPRLTDYERRATGFKLIASRLLELSQQQLISKPTKSNDEPVSRDDSDDSAVTSRRKQNRMIGRGRVFCSAIATLPRILFGIMRYA